jgi:hypothetical protein
MIKFQLLFLSFLLNSLVFSQLATGDWRIHTSFTNPSAVATDGKTVMCAFETSVLEYDIYANETSLWNYTNALSDITISTVYYDKTSNAYWVGYENGNIDKIKNNTVFNIPYLKLASITGSKKVNNFTTNNGKLYAVCDFGILVIDSDKNEIKDTYYTNNSSEKNLGLIFTSDSVYALTQKNIFRAKISNPILADYAQWKSIAKLALPSGNDSLNYTSITRFNNQLFIGKNKSGFNGDSVLIYNNGSVSIPFSDDLELVDLVAFNDKLYVLSRYNATIYDANLNVVDRIYNYSFGQTLNLSKITVTTDNTCYIADNDAGLVRFMNNWNAINVSPNGPASTAFYRATNLKDKMVFSGGRVAKFGPSYSQTKGYTLQDESWNYFSKYNQNQLTSQNVWDMNGVSIHPKDPNNYAFGSCGEKYSLFVVKDNKQISELYGSANTLIEDIPGNSVSCITDVKYDKKGNLWMLNTQSNYPLKVLTKDGVFYRFDTGSSTRQTFVDRLILDSDGNPWFTVPGVGAVGYFTNGTIEDASDDSYKILNQGENTGALPNNDLTDILLDNNGKLWFTSSQGFSILNNPSNVFSAGYGQYNTYRPKIEYKGDVEYFLGKTSITCGAVDGGNRKWLGTENAGLFCLAEDGYEIIYEYNMANSKIISNTIFDIEFNSVTGELFVLTDKGLVSIRTDASTGANDYKNVIVFPNPVKPDYEGVVTIQGIKTDSDVKVTDAAGNIVYSTTSNGGTATWNVKKVTGEKVASGVYLIWTAPKEEKGHKVGSVTVIR